MSAKTVINFHMELHYIAGTITLVFLRAYLLGCIVTRPGPNNILCAASAAVAIVV